MKKNTHPTFFKWVWGGIEFPECGKRNPEENLLKRKILQKHMGFFVWGYMANLINMVSIWDDKVSRPKIGEQYMHPTLSQAHTGTKWQLFHVLALASRD